MAKDAKKLAVGDILALLEPNINKTPRFIKTQKAAAIQLYSNNDFRDIIDDKALEYIAHLSRANDFESMLNQNDLTGLRRLASISDDKVLKSYTAYLDANDDNKNFPDSKNLAQKFFQVVTALHNNNPEKSEKLIRNCFSPTELANDQTMLAQENMVKNSGYHTGKGNKELLNDHQRYKTLKDFYIGAASKEYKEQAAKNRRGRKAFLEKRKIEDAQEVNELKSLPKTKETQVTFDTQAYYAEEFANPRLRDKPKKYQKPEGLLFKDLEPKEKSFLSKTYSQFSKKIRNKLSHFKMSDLKLQKKPNLKRLFTDFINKSRKTKTQNKGYRGEDL